MKIIKESVESAPSGISYEPVDYGYFIIYNDENEPVDVFEGSPEEFDDYMNANYNSNYSCDEVEYEEFDEISDKLFGGLEESIEQEQEDPKVIKFKEYYKNILGLPEDFELNSDNVDDWGFKRACNHLGWNYDSARANVLKETWKSFEEE